MLTHLLDISVYSQRLKPHPQAGIIEKWSKLGNNSLAISACCEAELLFDLEKKQSIRLWNEYDHYLKDQVTLLPFGYKEAAEYARLRQVLNEKGMPVADMDLQIAATAVANGLILATLNFKHFQNIPGLKAENWS